MTPHEALAEAIFQYEGWYPPNINGGYRGSRSWRNRNPGNLRPYNPIQAKDADDYRVFETLADGWTALRLDLRAKFEGSHGLTSASTMRDLLNVYAPAGDANNPTFYTTFVCQMTSNILGRTILPTTTLEEYLG